MWTELIVQFCRFLRDAGFQTGIQETLDALQVVSAVSVGDRETLKLALRALLSCSQTEYELFDRLFDQFWNPALPSEALRKPRLTSLPLKQSIEGKVTRFGSTESRASEIETKDTTGASAEERLRKMDFSKATESDLPLLEEIAFRLWKQMSTRIIRRWRAGGKDGPLDFRRTIRQSISHGGEPWDLRLKGKNRKKLHLVTLLDISGSMDLYSSFLLRFLYALHRYFRRVDSFVFGTRLTYISGALRNQWMPEMWKAISENVEDWSGGTRIGESLHAFNSKYANKLVSRNTVVMILSDGWDTGKPEMLSEELRSIKRRARKLIWLNPLLGLPDYRPETRGMAAALPYADVFAPAHNVQSLLELEHHL